MNIFHPLFYDEFMKIELAAQKLVTDEMDKIKKEINCSNENLVTCPFCGENDFDLPGLKEHLLDRSVFTGNFKCVIFNEIEKA